MVVNIFNLIHENFSKDKQANLSQLVFLLLLLLVLLGMEPRALHTPCKGSTTEVHPSPQSAFYHT